MTETTTHDQFTAPPSFRTKLRFGPQVAPRVPAGWVDEPFTRFELRPKSPTIGAEVVGIDLVDLDDETFAELHRALLEWKVLFIRDSGSTPTPTRHWAPAGVSSSTTRSSSTGQTTR